MLLTTIEVSNFDQACEKLDWYVQRWMIENCLCLPGLTS
jgi:hypothetical protein